jgi:hypothetical protein
MASLVRFGFVGDPLPHRSPGRAIQCDDFELMAAARQQPAARGVLRVADHVGWHGGRHEHAIAPHDRRRVPAARQLDLPADVFRFTPFERRVRSRRAAVRVRAAPLRPVPIGR